MKLTRPNNSSREFWSGVAVSSNLRLSVSASLSVVGYDIRRFVNISQPVASSITTRSHGVWATSAALLRAKLIGADDFFDFERAKLSLADGGVVGLCFEDSARQKELLIQLLVPLFAEIRRNNDQNPPLPLRPFL